MWIGQTGWTWDRHGPRERNPCVRVSVEIRKSSSERERVTFREEGVGNGQVWEGNGRLWVEVEVKRLPQREDLTGIGRRSEPSVWRP